MKEFLELSIFSPEETKKLAHKDANLCSANPERFVRENTLTYFLLSNTWIMLVKEYCPRLWIRFSTHLKTIGVIPCIKEMQEEADLVTHEESWGHWALLMKADFVPNNNLDEDAIGRSELRTILFLLRYPKRFSPSCNDKIQKETLDDFIRYENRTKMWQRHCDPTYFHIVDYVRDYIRRMYPWKTICRSIRAHLYDWVSVSTGSSLDAGPAYGYKIKACMDSGMFPDLVHPIFGEYLITRHPTCNFGRTIEPRYVRIQPVPKSYKASRIIAVDNTTRLVRGLYVESLFRERDRIAISKGRPIIDLEDQGVNQRLACIGSKTKEIATNDASHASDLISKSLYIDLLPYEYTALVADILPEKFIFPDKRVRDVQMASSSGNSLTFRHETIIYKGIVGAAEEYYERLTGESIQHYAWAYGDDSLINSKAYDVALFFFSVLGLIINEDKSFVYGSFRESCGKDYFDGVDVSAIYYPRFPILGSLDKGKVQLSQKQFRDSWHGKLENSLTMLIDLQKKVVPLSYSAGRLIASIVQTAYPQITTSVIGTVCNDLWDFVESGKQQNHYAYTRQDLGTASNVTLALLESAGNSILTEWDHMYVEEKGLKAEQSLSDESVSVYERASHQDIIHCYPALSTESLPSKSSSHYDGYTSDEIALYLYWKYESFLRDGPQYEDPLLELLHITSKPMTIGTFYGKQVLKLTYK